MQPGILFINFPASGELPAEGIWITWEAIKEGSLLSWGMQRGGCAGCCPGNGIVHLLRTWSVGAVEDKGATAGDSYTAAAAII